MLLWMTTVYAQLLKIRDLITKRSNKQTSNVFVVEMIALVNCLSCNIIDFTNNLLIDLLFKRSKNVLNIIRIYCICNRWSLKAHTRVLDNNNDETMETVIARRDTSFGSQAVRFQ